MTDQTDQVDQTADTADYPDVDPLTLDANAVAGILHEVFGSEMTGAEPLRPLRKPGRTGHAARLRP